MKQRFASRYCCGVFSAVIALSLGGFIAGVGCRGNQHLPADLTRDEIQEEGSTQGGGQPTATAVQVPSPVSEQAANRELDDLMKFEEANGYEIYQRYCMVCHGQSGEGDGFNAYNLDPKPRSLIGQYARDRLTDEELNRSISLGGAARNKSPLMPRWGHTLSTRQVRYVIAYIRLLQRQTQSAEAGPEISRQAPGVSQPAGHLQSLDSKGVSGVFLRGSTS